MYVYGEIKRQSEICNSNTLHLVHVCLFHKIVYRFGRSEWSTTVPTYVYTTINSTDNMYM